MYYTNFRTKGSLTKRVAVKVNMCNDCTTDYSVITRGDREPLLGSVQTCVQSSERVCCFRSRSASFIYSLFGVSDRNCVNMWRRGLVVCLVAALLADLSVCENPHLVDNHIDQMGEHDTVSSG